MTAFGEFVSTSVEDGIATIRIDRPKLNPLNAQVQEGLAAAAAEVSDDDAVAAVVLYGGERAFAAGADITEMRTMSYTDMLKRSARLSECFTAVARIPKPTVAAIEGYALGGGCELALACDFRVAGTNARLGQPEILLGVIPGAGGTQRLPRLVGPSRAKDIVFSGRFVEAQEALEIGLVDELAEPGQVYAAALARVRPYVGAAAIALRAAKEAVDRGLETDLATGLAIESQLFAGLFATKDRQIGMDSFVQEGPGKARFTGS